MSTVNSESCPYCPSSGPPIAPVGITSATAPEEQATASAPPAPVDDGPDELNWIECTKCKTWFHAVCALTHLDGRNTVPTEILREIEQNHRDVGAWTDFTPWVERWYVACRSRDASCPTMGQLTSRYCTSCIAFSNDPSNPRPPRYPFEPTLSPQFLKLSRSGAPKKRESDASTRNHLDVKRLRRSRSASLTPMDSDADESQAARSLDGEIGQENGEDHNRSSRISRPKRQVAMAPIDYHALHNHIPTPTAKWLRLINDPDCDIKEGKSLSTFIAHLQLLFLDSLGTY